MNKQVLIPTVTQMADFGTTEPFVARIPIGLCELLDGVILEEDVRTKAKQYIYETFEELSHAFLSLREINEFAEGKKQVLLVNQKKAYQDLYGYCWKSYKDRMPRILETIGVNIGFLFQKEEQFNNGAEAFKQKYPAIGDEFIRMVKADRDTWQNTVSKVRNDFIEHKKDDERSAKPMDYYFNPETAKLVFDNCWQVIEDIVVLCLTMKVVPGMKIGLIPENEIDDKFPKKFCFYATDL